MLCSWVLACSGTKPAAEAEDQSYLVGARSCVDSPPICGLSSRESCCLSPIVTGGEFARSNDLAAPAKLSAFRLDKYEVTVGRFRQFVGAYDEWRGAGHPEVGEGAHPRIPGTGWDAAWAVELSPNAQGLARTMNCETVSTWTGEPGQNELRPVGCLAWFQAFAFCLWDGGRLPTEAEWNFASAGGSEQRVFPWGDTEPKADAELAAYGCSFYGTSSCEALDIAPVGSIPAGNGKFGQADLAGNIWEWNWDWHAPYAPVCEDCANTLPSRGREIRGGNYGHYVSFLSSSYRYFYAPEYHGDSIGVRCARDLK